MKSISRMTLAASLLVVGCGGSMTRTPDQWQSEFRANVERKLPELRACYASAGVTGKVDSKIEIQFYEATPEAHVTLGGPVEGGNAKLDQCVDKIVKSFEFTPADSHSGKASWTFTFDPEALREGAGAAPSKAKTGG